MSNAAPINIQTTPLSDEDYLWTATCTWDDVFGFLADPTGFMSKHQLVVDGTPKPISLARNRLGPATVVFSFPDDGRIDCIYRATGHEVILQGINDTNVVTAYGRPKPGKFEARSWPGILQETNTLLMPGNEDALRAKQGTAESPTTVVLNPALGFFSTHAHLHPRDEGVQLIALMLQDPNALVQHLNDLACRGELLVQVEDGDTRRDLGPDESVQFELAKGRPEAMRYLFEEVLDTALPCCQGYGTLVPPEREQGRVVYRALVDQALVKPYATTAAAPADASNSALVEPAGPLGPVPTDEPAGKPDSGQSGT